MDVVLLEPLATRVIDKPTDIFTILARVVVHAVDSSAGESLTTNLASVYDEALDVTQIVRKIFTDFARPSPEIVIPNPTAVAKVVLAPFAHACVLGGDVGRLVFELRNLDSTCGVEISGDNVFNSRHPDFDPRILASRVIAEPLASHIRRATDNVYNVIVQLNTRLIADRAKARDNLKLSIDLLNQRLPGVVKTRKMGDAWHSYVFLQLNGEAVSALVERDRNPATGEPSIFRVWEDTEVHALIVKSIAAVKADAAQSTYSAIGTDIVWAVLDSGIDSTHPHFCYLDNLRGLPQGVRHRDFTAVSNSAPTDTTTTNMSNAVVDSTEAVRGTASAAAELASVSAPYIGDRSALIDGFGHGTHVSGIIAGIAGADPLKFGEKHIVPKAVVTSRDEAGDADRTLLEFKVISGMAPACKLVSYKILDGSGVGLTSSIIEALVDIRKVNELAGKLLVHGVNLSVGYTFDAEWFACGASPLCQEVDALVRSGVVVVCAAGNSGYGKVATAFTGVRAEGVGMSINDPGNAELAITVGSVHRDSPHKFGVSYFSSKGPTGDGRRKPDLVAPGEKIVSCASAQSRTSTTIAASTIAASPPASAPPLSVPIDANDYQYKEDSGTSMAAPHVSGVIAGFLSIRREYIGRPDTVKTLFMNNATDLQRDVNYQGAGLVDQMRVISSV